ncbi:predicted protein [Chaetoceros tenuissimus]|uniref:Uncharacterized protein n=1 Tax=Chaetoceros tenuissimus TaxID=426638 RepID=A0AAD3H6N8_9STRA|nr:predicted protein [Chaetoceros tenuissimus]
MTTTEVCGEEILVPSAMELIDDLDECLHETSLLFRGKHEKSASTSSYFQDEYPQFLSIVDHHVEFTAQYFDGYSKKYLSPSSGNDESPYMAFHFAQKCRNIGGMTQTHNLSMKCKWKDNDEELRLDMPDSPICISRKCDAFELREQLSIELARQVERYLKQQLKSKIGTCRVTSDVCVSETKLTQHVTFGYRTVNADPNTLTELYGVLGNCNSDNMDGYCLCETDVDEINCEQRGGQLITHKLQINYTGDLDNTRGFRKSDNVHNFIVFNYPHCISRICEVGRDAEDIERLFIETLNLSTQNAVGGYNGALANFDFSLKILNDDVKDYYNEPNSYDYSNDDETRSSHNGDATHRQGSTWKSTMKTFLAGVVSTAFAILIYLNFNSIKAAFRRYHSPEVVRTTFM